mmetsp:Transcript_16080/g.34769  ORF Transcript_16080/g.34769 Transcript_16080/m.34769 type:complete len:668 (-) Transcript_16080:120-2123(-)|eukprot:CAMPEP_0172311710 /NCGR_PEP_ID=MMETSP1058-20130122/15620_1 /TAXON_ID=83371 /ORGANISM="Detonula confervacea, Strain CCMP 353" /LENGTH=667 /DNA_ID=CAMNT_0013024987 /DNA_START=106 /DNA_END=2109 /DNA_ORIENTATION=+
MILSAILIICHLNVISGTKPAFPFSSMESPFKEENAYNKYDKYPPYCSTPEEMETRAVPPLQSNSGSSRIAHVTALIRHGARTPFMGAPQYQCWNGYWEDEETGVWNCDLKTFISPPAATKEKGQQVVDSEGMLEEEPDFLFEKRYDALTISPAKTGNNLNGTCQLGQLLLRGYDQELRNGLHLRQAYFYDGDNTADEHAASDSRMRLWDLTNDKNGGRKTSTPVIGDPTKQIYQEPNLRYRADDEQRTLMSGQVLLRGLFEKELLSADDDETAVIRLHTADYLLDVLGINKYTCPKTVDLYNEAYKSDEYKKWIDNSMEVKAVKKFVKEELGMDEMPFSMLDCLMTTICTDRTLPESLNDYDGSLGPTSWEESVQSSSTSAGAGESGDFTAMFERIANFAVKNFTFPYKYNNAAYPKLGMGPLWKEIMANILPIVDSTNNPSSSTPPPKLALFSGHDTTLMPILATLGEHVWSGTDWSPYASMAQIEIHEMMNSDEGSDFPSGYAFRLIYNGEVLTSKMDGCTAGSELCDSQVLVKHVMPFAKYQERDCASTTSIAPHEDNMMTEMKTATESLFAAPGGVWVVVALVIFFTAFGSIMTCYLMRRQMQKYHEYRRESLVLGDLSMRAVDDDEHHFHHEDSQGTASAISTEYGGTHGDEMKFDENNLI